MAFKGDLTNISLFDVFQTLNTNQQTGVLVLQRGGVTKKIFISPEGVRLFFTRSTRELRLGEIFVKRGLISAQDVEILLMQQKQEYRPIGELLVETGKVTEEDVYRTLRYRAEDEVYEVFGWESGSFSFFDGETDIDHGNTPLSDVLMDPGGLCLEAARRLDELERLRQTVPSDEDFYVRVYDVELDRDRSSASVCSVYDALEQPRTVDELRDLVGMSQFNVLGALVQLLDGGLARPLALQELIEEGRRARDAGEYERAARMLGNAHHRDPEDSAVLEDCVRVLERLDDPLRLSEMLATLGAARARAGDVETAIDQLEQALRHEPGNRTALIALRDCFATQQDDERAAETSLRIARTHVEDQDLQGAIEACRAGLAVSPKAIALRYYYAQLLARADERVLAQAELRELVETALTQKRALRNRKARELLSSCYRLLLRLDPSDALAEKGLRELVNQGGGSARRRKTIIRGSVAAAVLLVLSALGLTLMPESADDLLARARELRDEGDLAGMTALLERIQTEFPDTPEADAALALSLPAHSGNELRKQEALRARQKKLKEEFLPRIDKLGDKLATGDIQEGAGMLAGLLKELRDGAGVAPEDAEFLRSEFAPTVALKAEAYFERAREAMEADIRYVSSAEQSLNDPDKLPPGELANVIGRLTEIRQRDWPEASLQIDAYVGAAVDTGLLASVSKETATFRKFFTTRGNSFTHLTRVYYHAKSLELKERIRVAMDDARTRGRELLALCEFAKAREYYAKVLECARSARNPEVREHYQDVIAWIAQLNIERVAKRSLEDIDEVTASLKDVERFKKEGQADQAYRLMRLLIKEHRLIQFERRYKLPYMVESRPSGVPVTVDGKPAGKTPCMIEFEIVGRTTVGLEAPGFQPFERQLEIADASLDGKLDVALQKVVAWDLSLRGNPEARPVMAGSLVLVPTNEASLLALRVGDGGIEWEAKTGLLDRIKATPLTDGKDAHFVTISGRYFAVSLATGVTRQRLNLGGEVQHDGLLINGTIYYVTQNRKLVAIRDGKIHFERPLDHDAVTSLLRMGEELVFGTADGFVLFHSMVDGREVRRLQSSDRSSFFDGVAVQGNLVVGMAEDGYLYGFDPRQPKFTWRTRIAGNLAAPPIATKKYLYLASVEGFLSLYDAEGQRRGQVDMRQGFNGTPVVHRDFLYAPAGGMLVAHDMESGQSWWEVQFTDERPVHVAVSDRCIVVVTDKGHVVAYPADNR